LPDAWDSVCSAQIEFQALQLRANEALERIRESLRHSQVPNASAEVRQIIGGNPHDKAAEIAAHSLCEAIHTATDWNEAREATLGEISRRAAVATVSSVSDAIVDIETYPASEISSEGQLAAGLQGALATYTPQRIDEETSADIAEQEKAAHAKIAHPPPAPSRDATASIKETSTSRLNHAKDALAAIIALLEPYGSTGGYYTLYSASAALMANIKATALANVSENRFFVVIPEDCSGLYGASRTTTITVNRSPNVANSVTVTCSAREFPSIGYAFSALPQRQYSAVPANSNLPQPPSGSPTPAPATVQQTSYSDIRPMPIVLLNVRFAAEEPGDNGYYGSSGVSVNSSPASTTLDYLGGISYSLGRSLIATAGVELGPTTILAPGYNIGDPIAANGSPPTVTRLRSAIFLAITYGSH
jgi:hypothetical protein